MVSFDTTSTMQFFVEEHNSKITNHSVAIVTSKPVQNAFLLVVYGRKIHRGTEFPSHMLHWTFFLMMFQ